MNTNEIDCQNCQKSPKTLPQISQIKTDKRRSGETFTTEGAEEHGGKAERFTAKGREGDPGTKKILKPPGEDREHCE
jgi:hypothetical protein